MLVLESDPDRDARFFEPVVQAVEAIATGVEVVRPGLLAVPVRGPASYFGSEETAAERVLDEVEARVDVESQVGVADGLFAAILAARRAVVIPPGGDAEFLAPLPIAELEHLASQSSVISAGPGGDAGGAEAESSDSGTSPAAWLGLLSRLGIDTLGSFAALPESDVANRFGAAVVPAHRAAGGREQRPPERRVPAANLAVTRRYESTLDRVDEVAFAAKGLAEQLHMKLRDNGVACVRLGITARTENDEQLYRAWRCAEPLSAAGTADRVRWQLDGWLTGRGAEEVPSAGVQELELLPEELVAAGALQFDLLDSSVGKADERAERVLTRVLGMLGPNAVLTGVLDGGRDVRDRVHWVPWGSPRYPALDVTAPWPGRIPPPSPAVVPAEPWPVRVLDGSGASVEVDIRGWLSATPHQVVFRSRVRRISGWAGPWPAAERWWAGNGHRAAAVAAAVAHAGEAPMRTGARMQVVLAEEPADHSAAVGGVLTDADADADADADDGAGMLALLLSWEDADWWVLGTYH